MVFEILRPSIFIDHHEWLSMFVEKRYNRHPATLRGDGRNRDTCAGAAVFGYCISCNRCILT